ncbi:MAG: hypothetical protein AB1478_08455 [Nitrospirota bacterium]
MSSVDANQLKQIVNILYTNYRSETSDWENIGEDNNVHYFKSITEHEGRVLHVVVNPHVLPKKVVTVFFDRKARRQK